ncbi:MAG: putative glycoside hydrolase [bacterium]|nr:putative glycoside hydrolase [bacterium]
MDQHGTTNDSPRSTATSHGERSSRRTIASWFAVLLLAVGLLSLPVGAQRKPHQYPRLANLFLAWHLSEEEARDLARWDVIVLDMEVARNTPVAFDLLRRTNPEAKLFAYVTAQEIRRDAAAHPQAALRRDLAARIADAWYLTSAVGDRISWWPQTWLLDITDPAWTDALATFVAEEIATDARWDGVYYDNLWGSISWLDRGELALAGAGSGATAAQRDRAWVDGTRRLLTATRARVPEDFLITGNGSSTYADLVNGLLLEHFPNTNEGDWSASMRALFAIVERGTAPVFAMVNTNTGNTGVWQNFRLMRFGLTSALLGGGYASFDFGDQDHAQRWWYDEYEAFLGDPVGKPFRIDAGGAFDPAFPTGVYRREYAHGIVLVNATAEPFTVAFDEEFERLRGEQDPAVNSGEIIQSLTLAPHDGTVLLRPIIGITGAPFANGAFARVFDHAGRVVRNGFFAYDATAAGSATVEHRDLDGDGARETITAEGGRIRIASQGRTVREFAPFGEVYTDGLDFAIDDLDDNRTWEIVVTERDRGARVGIFNLLEGRLLTPYLAPFGAQARSGMTVATARRDRLSRPIIVVGAGAGIRPEVRILDWSGRPTGASFLAYTAGFRGGVRVAAGDVDRDGDDEIITGAGPGGGPHVRVFDALSGVLQVQFFAFDADRRGGVDVAAADLDGDGRDEILGMSTHVFTVAQQP